MAVIAFVLVSLYLSVRNGFTFSREILPLVGIYLLMVFSLLWTIDFNESVKALSKEIPLLIIPIVFAFTKGFSNSEKQQIQSYYAYGFTLIALVYFCRAIIRFALSGNTDVFFYHELVTFDVNAIHVSVYAALAFFILITKQPKRVLDILAALTLLTFIFLLSSKNIIFVFVGLSLVYLVRLKQKFSRMQIGLATFVLLVAVIAFYGKISARLEEEIKSNSEPISVNDNIGGQHGLVYNVSVSDAWSRQYFRQNEYFPGTALRVYQARIFFEMLKEDALFFTGYGVNATDAKIVQKRKEHNLYSGYDNYNFHNQYIQNFAETGILSLIFLLIALYFNLKNAVKNKDFIHFSFAILMISLFLTESFLSRQRGVVFFTLMYCYFNTYRPEKIAKNTI